jgi:hypothetical protein
MKSVLLLVLIVVILILIIKFFYVQYDGFQDSSAVRATHTSFITDQLKKYGSIGISLITADKTGSLGDSATNALLSGPSDTPHPLQSAPSGLFATIKICEAIQTMDCNAFDDPKFKLDCGVCLDIGRNSKGESIPGGGLVLLNDEKTTTKKAAVSNFLPKYTPTVGFCPAGKMVSTKEECIRLQKELLCQKNKTFDLPDCSQCFTGSNYSVVDKNTIISRGSISIIGSGLLTIQEQGFEPITNIKLSTKPYSFDLRVQEGGNIKFMITPNGSTQVYIAGILTGPTTGGIFVTDLVKLVLVDEVSGRKPRSSGKMSVNSNQVTKIAPIFGQTKMTIVTVIPFSFVDTETEEASRCTDGPYSTKPNVFTPDPCYAKGAAPGNYNLECLQNIWFSNGCNQSGKAYPDSPSNASRLMSNTDGSLRNLNDISDFIYNKALIAYTGIDENGQKQTIQDWSDASLFCTGVAITSPCDGPGKETGPLSADCLVYLWKNAGANNPLGATYSGYGTSLFPSGSSDAPQYCQATGTLSPSDANGKIKEDIVVWWQDKGGVTAVKKIMSDIYAAANAQASSDDQRSPYITQCYGSIPMAKPPAMNPSTIPLRDLQTMYNQAGCSKQLSEADVAGNWRKFPSIASIQSDMNLFSSLTTTCQGNNNQTQFCIPGSCPTPSTIPLATLQSMFNTAGCSKQLSEGEVGWWRGRPAISDIQNDMNAYGSLTASCQGNSGQTQFCKPGSCQDKRVRFDNVNINGGGCSVNRNIGNFPDVNACADAARKLYPSGKYAVTFYPGQCWAIGPTDPYDRHYNPAGGWTSIYFRPAGEADIKMPSIANVGFVRIQGTGRASYLNMSQLVVYDDTGANVSRGRPVKTSQLGWGTVASTGNDGNEMPRPHPGVHGMGSGTDFWQVQLDRPTSVSSVVVYNRSDCCADRLGSGYVIQLINPGGSVIWTSPTLNASQVQKIVTK